MGKLFALYGTSTGRISRRTWWFGVLWLGVANIVLFFVVLFTFGANLLSNFHPSATEADIGPDLLFLIGSFYWAQLTLLALSGYPLYCLCAKRRHDRGRSGLDVFGYLLLSGVVTLLLAWGLGFVRVQVDPSGTVPVMTNWLYNVMPLQQLYLLYLTIVLGFLPGAARDNEYGADPIKRAVVVPAVST